MLAVFSDVRALFSCFLLTTLFLTSALLQYVSFVFSIEIKPSEIFTQFVLYYSIYCMHTFFFLIFSFVLALLAQSLNYKLTSDLFLGGGGGDSAIQGLYRYVPL